MSLTLNPGAVSLNEWRAIYCGQDVSIARSQYSVIERGSAHVEQLLRTGKPIYGINTGFGKLASVRIAGSELEALQRNIVLSHAAGVGEAMPAAVVRLMMALKLGSLVQGFSGVSTQTVELLAAMLARGVLPTIPGQGSVGASGDLAPLSHLAACMIGVGTARVNGQLMSARDALGDVGLEPARLAPKEGLALLNGTQFSTALALAALFEAETLFRSALITGALSTEAARGADAPFDQRIHAVRRHRGQIESAEALRALMMQSQIRASHLEGDDRVQDPYCLRCQPQVMGAALDVLRQAGTTLATEANGVTDNPLVFPEQGDVLSGGNFHAEPVAFAADMIALAICEIGSLAERRIAMLVDPAISRLPAFLTPNAGLNSGFMIPQVTAAALVSENKQSAYPASVDSIPTSANQEDHVSMAAHGARRLLRMLDNAFVIVGVEYLAAVQGCDFHAPLRSSAALERARALLRDRVPSMVEDRYMHPDMSLANELLRSRQLVDAVAVDVLPSICEYVDRHCRIGASS